MKWEKFPFYLESLLGWLIYFKGLSQSLTLPRLHPPALHGFTYLLLGLRWEEKKLSPVSLLNPPKMLEDSDMWPQHEQIIAKTCFCYQEYSTARWLAQEEHAEESFSYFVITRCFWKRNLTGEENISEKGWDWRFCLPCLLWESPLTQAILSCKPTSTPNPVILCSNEGQTQVSSMCFRPSNKHHLWKERIWVVISDRAYITSKILTGTVNKACLTWNGLSLWQLRLNFALLIICREGNGNPLQYSCLGNPTDRGASQATVHESAKMRTGLKRLSVQTLIIWGRETVTGLFCSSLIPIWLYVRKKDPHLGRWRDCIR